MAASFFFYDLETSGFDPRNARIMQFAGRRTDLELTPIGGPVNILIKMTPDVLPDPDAVMVTGITPQMTLENGVTEAEFLRTFQDTICQPDTIFAGFNSIRFDDEFMRYLLYRNFYDAYRWQWCDGCSKWDLMDVVRMTRALRPEGIKWPFGSDGSASNRLELLTSVNGLAHANAHDALSDVDATIAIASLIKGTQPKLFNYLLDIRDKKKVKALVESGQPFVYTSGAYPGEFQKTTIAMKVAPDSNNQGALVFDLRQDPDAVSKLSVKQLADLWRWRRDRPANEPILPVKALRYNRCPAIAPLSVLDGASMARLKLDMNIIESNRRKLSVMTDFGAKLLETQRLLDDERPQASLLGNEHEVDGQLYNGFLDPKDTDAMGKVRAATALELPDLEFNFHDSRLSALLPLYKARNFPGSISNEERKVWENFRIHRLHDRGPKSRLAKYFLRLQSLANSPGITQPKRFLIEELHLYGESIAPTEDAA